MEVFVNLTRRRKKIKTTKDYQEALLEFSLLFDSPEDSYDYQRLLKLKKMIADFEKTKFGIKMRYFMVGDKWPRVCKRIKKRKGN